MATESPVTPNRRGARSREAVLDAAERLIADQGYDAATIAALVDEAGLPASSIYHYFGSKQGVLLAVMERGADRYFESLPDFGQPDGGEGYLEAAIQASAEGLERNPHFLRILIVVAVQPPEAAPSDVRLVVNRVREEALGRLRTMVEVAFGVPRDGEAADQLARFALASFDGAFIAKQSSPDVEIGRLLAHLPAALAAVRNEIAA